MRTFGPQKAKGAVILIVNACSSRDVQENVVGVCFVGQDVTGQKMLHDKFTRIHGDYKSIVQNPNPLIPPIFGSDDLGYCTEWSPSMEKLTGWKRDEVMETHVTLLVAGYLVCTLMCTRLSPQPCASVSNLLISVATFWNAGTWKNAGWGSIWYASNVLPP